MESDNNLIRRRKRKRFEEWMDGDHVLVQLDARAEGVCVPSHLQDNPALTLKLSYRFQGKTSVDEDGISSFLRFSGDYFECIIPWDAVWGLTSSSNETEVWTEDVPKEVLLQIACSKISDFGKKIFGKKQDGSSDGGSPSEPTGESKSPIRSCIEPAPKTSENSPKGSAECEVRRKKPNLKLIKK